MKQVTSWGRLSNELHNVHALNDRVHLGSVMETYQPGLAYGNGRSYGDVCLNPNGNLWLTTGLNKLISFDETLGRLVCEAGVLLRDIQRLLVPRGWMLPVTPGTQLITLGGAIANDVHGKNYHAFGSFGNHVLGISLARSTGVVMELNWADTPEMMSATLGGMGLTGTIVSAELQLRRVENPWLSSEKISFLGLSEFFELADASEQNWEHTVAWVDCSGGQTARGIFSRANPISAQEIIEKSSLRPKRQWKERLNPISFPITPPFSLVNGMTLNSFNLAYYYFQKMNLGLRVTHYEPFLYPLDSLNHWNRIYGQRGFYQYQAVLPREVDHFSVKAMLDVIAASGEGSFLAVLKTFGNREAKGMLSFPQPGVTLAVDFPNRSENTLKLFDRLDSIVRESRGRLYTAKDSRMSRDLFEIGYPRLPEFWAHRDSGVSSAMSRRLMGI